MKPDLRLIIGYFIVSGHDMFVLSKLKNLKKQ